MATDGHERFGQPCNPNFLLRPNELLVAFAHRLTVLAFEQDDALLPRFVVMQRICAIYRTGNVLETIEG